MGRTPEKPFTSYYLDSKFLRTIGLRSGLAGYSAQYKKIRASEFGLLFWPPSAYYTSCAPFF
jgi:hypothetical protein